MSYVKLFDSIVASTIWMAPSETRVVWITMLAIADRDGNVMASVPGLAHLCRVSRAACEAALDALMAPDLDSRTKTNEGRRIAPIDGGWVIINYEKYRDKATLAEKQEKDRLRQQRKRDRDAASRNVTPVTDCHAASQPVTESRLSSDRIGSDLTQKEIAASASRRETPSEEIDPRFLRFWEAYGRKGSRKQSLAQWKRLRPTDEMAAEVIAAAKVYRASQAHDPKFQRDGQRWLRDEGWNDQVVQSSSAQVNASGRPVVEASTMHIPNMPLGHESCNCPGCAAAKLSKSIADAKNVSTHIRAPHSA